MDAVRQLTSNGKNALKKRRKRSKMQNFKNYNPLKITGYHGTNADIDSFKGLSYFSSDKSAAEGYARGKVSIHKSGKAKVYQSELTFHNPHVVDSMQAIGSIDHKYAQELIKKGHDGVVYHGNKKEPIPEYLPLHPEKIKISKVYDV